MKHLRIFLIISVLLCPSILRADIYRHVDADGVVHFTNTPCNAGCDLYLREGPAARPHDPPGDVSSVWMEEYVDRFSRAHRLSPALVKAIIRAESGGERFAVSPKGAQGMMQLMPPTARYLNVSDPFDPVENIEGGVKYLKELLGTFGGNLVHAVAAYNAGPAAVKKYGGIPPYKETRLYVKRVMDYYEKYSLAE
jgi:hypothetical protein